MGQAEPKDIANKLFQFPYFPTITSTIPQRNAHRWLSRSAFQRATSSQL